ncbi:uncharacterized protein LOC143471206 [Clavelina lepadiformis]|uniref:uncharacterized protein LOC143471206 n=1 Tax=Clavelina lepadiformis TaxID=159417 RepID=UPI004041BB5F
MKLIATLVVTTILMHVSEACHAYEHGARKRRQTEAEESSSSYELGYDADALITFFTSCMSSTSAIAMDWYSVTDWAIVDSNWFYYSDNADCFGEEESNETLCWLSRVDDFLVEQMGDYLKDCINQFALDSNDTSYDVQTSETSERKKRQLPPPQPATLPGTFPPLPGRLPPPPGAPPPVGGGRDSRCPEFARRDYSNQLLRDVPLGFRKPPPPLRRPPLPRRARREAEEEGFNITSVVDFVDSYTVCSECERYTGEEPTGCYAIRFDQLTRFGSNLKGPIQRANARYAGGSDVVGKCQGSVHWTEWFNTDNPNEGLGDVESLSTIQTRYRNNICVTPSGIQARLAQSNQSYGRGNNLLDLSPTTGLSCLNRDQSNSICQDYRVRFCCPDYVGECPLRHGWSKYFDESDPIRRFGEFEVLSEIRRKNPGSVCTSPTAVGAKLLSGQPYLAGGESLQLDPSSGLVCFSAFQSDRRCNDYKVRFCCPDTIGKCEHGHKWTRWQDTMWRYGDDETFKKLVSERGLGCESTPSAIQAQVSGTRKPYISGGDTLYISPSLGLFCLNGQQSDDKKCKNYRVRFCCQLPPKRLHPPTNRPPTTTGGREENQTGQRPTDNNGGNNQMQPNTGRQPSRPTGGNAGNIGGGNRRQPNNGRQPPRLIGGNTNRPNPFGGGRGPSIGPGPGRG